MSGRRERKRSVKQKIRDTRRLLSKEDLPETVRLTKGRVLKCLELELGEKQEEAREKKLAKKYRMVKFFDKRKVTRKLKGKIKELCNCEDEEKAEILSSISELRKELNYVMHYPPGEKYLALYPSSESTDAHALARKEHFLQQIAEMVETGEVPDASVAFLPPDLQTTPYSSQRKDHVSELGRVVGDTSFHPHPGGHQVRDETRDRPLRGRGKSLGKSRRRVAAVDEEPEVDYVLQSKRKLVDEDDFFMQDTAS